METPGVNYFLFTVLINPGSVKQQEHKNQIGEEKIGVWGVNSSFFITSIHIV